MEHLGGAFQWGNKSIMYKSLRMSNFSSTVSIFIKACVLTAVLSRILLSERKQRFSFYKTGFNIPMSSSIANV